MHADNLNILKYCYNFYPCDWKYELRYYSLDMYNTTCVDYIINVMFGNSSQVLCEYNTLLLNTVEKYPYKPISWDNLNNHEKIKLATPSFNHC